MNKRTAIALVALVAFAGCATSTLIQSEPPGAKVYDSNGTELGTTPYTHESSIWIWESDKLELRKDGYKNKTVEVSRNEIDVMPTVGAAALTLCLLPTAILWVSGPVLFVAGGMKFPDETTVKLESGAGSGSDVAPTPIACPTGLPVAMIF